MPNSSSYWSSQKISYAAVPSIVIRVTRRTIDGPPLGSLPSVTFCQPFFLQVLLLSHWVSSPCAVLLLLLFFFTTESITIHISVSLRAPSPCCLNGQHGAGPILENIQRLTVILYVNSSIYHVYRTSNYSILYSDTTNWCIELYLDWMCPGKK